LPRYERRLTPDQWLTAFSPYTVSSFFIGFCKSWMGRLDEARTDFREHRRLSEEDGTPEFIGYNLLYFSELHYHAHDGGPARDAAREIEELTMSLGEPPSLAAYTRLSLAFCCMANDDAAGAIEAARGALELLEVAEKFQAGVAATILAEALLESGDAEAAQLAASDAIELCRRSIRQNYLALARCIHARARLRVSGSDAFDEVHATFDEVEDLIAELGASTLSPRLLEWRAELAGARGDDRERERLLRAAQQGYTEIDAPRRAEAINASTAST
jgi:hypothetical protein